jgi:hypothetical protein
MQHSTLVRLLKESENSNDSEKVVVPAELFRKLLIGALRAKNVFDEHFYLAINSDLVDALRKKKIESVDEHYYNTGYFENRLPRKLIVDEKYYLEQNPDVAEAIRKGIIKSAQEHFEYAGFREGRAPHKDFSLF